MMRTPEAGAVVLKRRWAWWLACAVTVSGCAGGFDCFVDGWTGNSPRVVATQAPLGSLDGGLTDAGAPARPCHDACEAAGQLPEGCSYTRDEGGWTLHCSAVLACR